MHMSFAHEAGMTGVLPLPTPAIQSCPEYFKKIKPSTDAHPANGTAKRCVPFLDALSLGYIIPLWADMYVQARSGDLKIDFPPMFPQTETLGQHSADQLPKHPKHGDPYGELLLKFISPWIISTDPGYSCLFTSPLNHLETRFKLMDGVVDTDTYYNDVNFPFIWTGGDGDFLIPKGTPLVQVIPFKREPVTVSIEETDLAKRRQVRGVLGTKLKNGYRDEFWNNRKALSAETLGS